MPLGPEIPAARALQQIPADGRDIADLRTCRRARGIREAGIAQRDERVASDRRNGCERANPNAPTMFRLYEVETGHPPQIDNRSGGNEIFLHEVKEIDTACFHDIASRPYAFALLATNLAIFVFIRWMTQPQIQYAVLFGVAAAAILYFHYLFGVILPAFAIYYLAMRGRSIKADVRQLAAVLATFILFAAPLILRVLSLYRTRQTHVVPELAQTVVALKIFAPQKLLIGFLIAVFVAALVRKLKLPDRDCFPAILLCPLLALVPGAILYSISAVTPLHLFISRYCLVAVPGSVLTWGLLTSRIDSRLLRQMFCVGLVVVTILYYHANPYMRKHELSFKPAFELVNANVAPDKAPILMCSAFIESDYESMPAPASENALLSQASYYPLDAPTALLPFDLNDETIRVASQSVQAAAQRHQRFLVIAGPASYSTLEWLVSYLQGMFVPREMGEFDGIVVLEFSPIARSD